MTCGNATGHQFSGCLSCQGCCLFFALEVCDEEWGDPCDELYSDKGKKDWKVIYVDNYNPEPGCEPCLEESAAEGRIPASCGSSTDSGVWSCTGACDGSGYECWPTTPGLWKDRDDKCWYVGLGCGTKRRAILGPHCEGECASCGTQEDGSPCLWCPDSSTESPGQCVEVTSWCDFTVNHTFEQEAFPTCPEELSALCGEGCCCDDPGGGDGPCCDPDGVTCPPDKKCCDAVPELGYDECFCWPRDKPCPEYEEPGPCDTGSPCCEGTQDEPDHNLRVFLDIESSFNIGGLCGCQGGAEDDLVEALGSPTWEKQWTQNNPYCSEGTSGTQFIRCSRGNTCGTSPTLPGPEPVGSVATVSHRNCDQIDGCCNGDLKITDKLECGQGSLWTPPVNDCPKGCSMYGMRHVGYKQKTNFVVPCSYANSSNQIVFESNSYLDVPRIGFGHRCLADGNGSQYGGCVQANCQFEGSPNHAESFSVGYMGLESVAGAFSGQVTFVPQDAGNQCIGTALITLTFTPSDSNLFSVVWNFQQDNVQHFCNDFNPGDPSSLSRDVFSWFDFDVSALSSFDWLETLEEAQDARQNCGFRAPSIFDPSLGNPMYELCLQKLQAGESPDFNALELQDLAVLMGGGLSNLQGSRSGYDTSSSYNDVFDTQGWLGCKIPSFYPQCQNCPNSIVDFARSSFSRGKMWARIHIYYE